jgi:hypothetical protein
MREQNNDVNQSAIAKDVFFVNAIPVKTFLKKLLLLAPEPAKLWTIGILYLLLLRRIDFTLTVPQFVPAGFLFG